LPDPRTGNATRHDLLEVLAIALTAAICGAEDCSDFADFGVDRDDLFREFLELKHGIPSHDTFSRLFRLLDPAAFSGCFGRFVEDLGAADDGVVAIDGKTLRRSFDSAAGRSPLAVVTAFRSATSVVIGQEPFRTAEGESEIVAARALLRCLDLTGLPDHPPSHHPRKGACPGGVCHHQPAARQGHPQPLDLVRAHWGVENRLHSVRDVADREY